MAQESHIRITLLTDRGDQRGSSFSVHPRWAGFLPDARDIHITTLRPGHIRGNHYHKLLKEVIIVIHAGAWTLHYDSGPGTPVVQHAFAGSGAVLLTVEPHASHAIVNTGSLDLYTLALTDAPFDPEKPDTYAREIVRQRT